MEIGECLFSPYSPSTTPILIPVQMFYRSGSPFRSLLAFSSLLRRFLPPQLLFAARSSLVPRNLPCFTAAVKLFSTRVAFFLPRLARRRKCRRKERRGGKKEGGKAFVAEALVGALRGHIGWIRELRTRSPSPLVDPLFTEMPRSGLDSKCSS